MALCGLGFALFQAPNNRTLLAAAPRTRAGAAGGMLAMSRFLGMTVGATVAAAVFRIAGGSARTVDLWIAAGFAAAGSAISLTRAKRPEPRAAPVEGAPV